METEHSKVYPCNVAINNRKAWRRDVYNFTMKENSQVTEAISIVTMNTDNGKTELIHSNKLHSTLL